MKLNIALFSAACSLIGFIVSGTFTATDAVNNQLEAMACIRTAHADGINPAERCYQ